MHLHPDSPEAAAFVADHLADGVSLADALHDHAFRCEDCDRYFSQAADVNYGFEDDDRVCLDCGCERGSEWRQDLRYGRGF